MAVYSQAAVATAGGKPIVILTSFLTNPIADSYSGGVVESIYRKFSFNNRIDFDLEKLTEGLSFHTNLSFDYFIGYSQTVANLYSVYEPVWDPVDDKIISLVQGTFSCDSQSILHSSCNEVIA